MADIYKRARTITIKCTRIGGKSDPDPWFATATVDDERTFHCSRGDDPIKTARRALALLDRHEKRKARKAIKNPPC